MDKIIQYVIRDVIRSRILIAYALIFQEKRSLNCQLPVSFPRSGRP
jgi:hypothetical protein